MFHVFVMDYLLLNKGPMVFIYPSGPMFYANLLVGYNIVGILILVRLLSYAILKCIWGFYKNILGSQVFIPRYREVCLGFYYKAFPNSSI